MILTDEEKRMRDGAEGAATAAAMNLLIRYGDALACDRLCDVRNVAGTMTQQLEPLLDGDALTVTGRTLAQNLAGVIVADEDVIRSPERALGRRPTIVLIRGSLAPDGGLVKLAVADDRRVLTFGLDRRRASLQAPAAVTPGPAPERGWLYIYQRLVRPLPEGAVLIPGERAP